MNNQEFIADMAECIGDTAAPQKTHGNLIFEGGVLYSYGRHYPLLVNVGGRVFVNVAGYSNTTSKHIAYARQYAEHEYIAYRHSGEYTKTDKNSILEYLEQERSLLENELKELSSRAWKQKEIKEARIEEINLALKDIQ